MNLETLTAEIASRLRAERARANLTLRDAAAKSGIHYVSISRYEQGKLPTVESLYLLAGAYGVEAVALLPTLAEVKKPKKK